MRSRTNRSDRHFPHDLFPCPGLEFVVSASAQSGAGCHGLAGSPFRFSQAISPRPTGREIPSFFILAIKVVRFSPNRAAAPLGPPIIHRAACKARKIRARVEPSNVPCEGVTVPRFLSDAETGLVAAFFSDFGSGFESVPVFDRM